VSSVGSESPSFWPRSLGKRVLGLDRRGEREDHVLGAVERVVELLQAQRRADARYELRALHRLGHEVVGAGLERHDPVSRLAEAGDHHHREQAPAWHGLDAPAHLVAVHARHAHVKQHEIRLPGLDHLERADAVGCLRDVNVDRREIQTNELAVRRAVVDDQHDRHQSITPKATRTSSYS
jgi:hypothetical protein